MIKLLFIVSIRRLLTFRILSFLFSLIFHFYFFFLLIVIFRMIPET